MSLEPITDPPTFTLTCVTTGGPPTTVTWTRDNTEIDYQSNGNFTFSQRVTNFVSSTYNNTLTVNGRHLGQYNMTAWNRNTVLYISNQVATSAISVTGKYLLEKHGYIMLLTLHSPAAAARPPTSLLCKGLIPPLSKSPGLHQSQETV